MTKRRSRETDPVPSLPALSNDEIRRYSRQIILPDVGLEGQRLLKSASVLIIGTGGLGSPAALYLTAAGVGRIGIVDHDVVDVSNLHRQILHGSASLGARKVESARERLREVNPLVQVDVYDEALTSENAVRIASPYDVVIDASDNFATRYLSNDLCVLLGKPNVYGAVLRFEGQVSVFDAKRGPCYRCVFPTPPPADAVPTCTESGIL
ncbi:MAG: HesA/MoeB/ThiF family protein, partial [Candidatus Bipolaricaulis sp.]|nr:HesA/MoeB/ThiF family protein [Candidatus Bipolaricaulis sp.]